MAFTGLEQRFNEKVNQLYAGAKNKFDDGRASTGRTDEPFIVRKPGDGQPGIKLEGRSLPVVSAAQDLKRLTLFTISKRGLVFLAKQQLLQTGNTFEHTRVINPLFVVSNAIPFLHVRRQLRPFSPASLLGGGAIARKLFGGGKQETDVKSLRKIGQLQQETYDKVTSAINAKSLIKKIPVIGQTISAFSAKRSMGEVGDYKNSRPELSKLNLVGALTTLFTNKGSKSGYVVGNQRLALRVWNDKMTIPAVQKYGADLKKYNTYLKSTDGQENWTHVIGARVNSWQEPIYNKIFTDPELYTANFSNRTQQRKTLSDEANKTGLASVFDQRDGASPTIPRSYSLISLININDFIKNRNNWYKETLSDSGTEQVDALPYLKYFDGRDSIKNASQFDFKTLEGTNARDNAIATRTTTGNNKISYIRDKSNDILSTPTQNIQSPYNKINTLVDETNDSNWTDPITVSFAMGKDAPVRFRAFITDLQQRANPQYKASQYIGRMEKFINYTGVQREISFTLRVVAFSKDELDGVWTRINYLTGLVFPYGYNKGIMQPNITKLTIGDVYTDQPGYVTALDTTFNDAGESWEIDQGKQVPIAATMRMSFTLIEKRTKIAASPFYRITENNSNFIDDLTPLKPKEVTPDPKNDQPSNDTPVKVDVENRTYDRTGFPDVTAKADNTRVRKLDDLVYDPFLKVYTANPRPAAPATLFNRFSGAGGGSRF